MKNQYRFTRPPKALRRPNILRDNLTLLPASLLPYKAQWQKIANNLTRGSVLIVLPTSPGRQRRVLESVAQSLGVLGKQVRVISTEQMDV